MTLKRRDFLKWLIFPIANYFSNAAHGIEKRSVYDIRDFGAAPEINNFRSLSKAIEAAHNNAGIVYIPSGTWSIDLSESPSHLKQGWKFVQIKSNISIIGDGEEKSILKITAGINQRSSVLAGVKTKSIELTGFTIDCNFYGHRSQYVDARINGITFFDSEECLIEKVSVVDGYGYGIWIDGGQRNACKSCFVRGFEDNIELTNTSNNLIFNNKIYCDHKNSASYRYENASVNSGIILYQGGSYNFIVANSITTIGMGAGISTYSAYKDDEGNGPSNCYFSDNILNVDGFGLILSGRGHQIVNNHINSFGYPSLTIWGDSSNRDLLISNNSFSADFSNGGSGPYYHPYSIFGRGTVQNALFLSNDITTNGTGSGSIYLKGQNITLIENTIDQTQPPIIIDK